MRRKKLILFNLSEIFFSLQGESSLSGLPTVFIRFAGCPLRCAWCDTAYAFKPGNKLKPQSIFNEVNKFRVKRVCLTGGEPLAQRGIFDLVKLFCDEGYETSIETGGMFDISALDNRALIVLDVKPPGSGEVEKNYWPNFNRMPEKSEVKFVLASRTDYEWAKTVIAEYSISGSKVLFSAASGFITPKLLARWILDDRLNVRMQLQLHKVLWQGKRGR